MILGQPIVLMPLFHRPSILLSLTELMMEIAREKMHFRNWYCIQRYLLKTVPQSVSMMAISPQEAWVRKHMYWKNCVQSSGHTAEHANKSREMRPYRQGIIAYNRRGLIHSGAQWEIKYSKNSTGSSRVLFPIFFIFPNQGSCLETKVVNSRQELINTKGHVCMRHC